MNLGDIEKRFDTNLKLITTRGENQKINGIIKDKLSRIIMKEFVALIPKMYSYLTDDGCVDKKAKDEKMCVIKHELISEDFKTSLEKTGKMFRSKAYKVSGERENKIVFSTSDEKRLQTCD